MGVLPIDLGPAKLQRTQHTFVHFYHLQSLFDEFKSLNNQYDDLKLAYNNNLIYSNELGNYDSTVRYTQKLIFEKIDNLRINTRDKRGLVDFLGTVVKGITGNLDASDGERIYKILTHLEKNEKNLQEQIKMEYSLSHNIIQNFNDTIHDIQHNELILKSRIMQLSQMVKEEIHHINLLFAKDNFNQLVILYNTILNTLQEIETSVTFCKLNTLHPSIITSRELFSELQKISPHYANQFPFEMKFDNILDFETIIKLNCKLDHDRITYFLSVPIDFEKNFELYYILPIPTKHESEFVTLIPSSRYFLKSINNDIVKPLRDVCTRTQGKLYHCPSNLQSSHNTACEEDILLHENTSRCQFSKLEILENHIEIVTEVNQYLAVLPKEEKLKIQCENQIETKSLIGIYLIEGKSCKILFHGEELTFQESTHAKPVIVNSVRLTPKKIHQQKFKVELKKLDLRELPINPMISIDEEPIIPDLRIPSAWTIILYIAIIIIAAVILYTKFKRTRAPAENQNKDMPTVQVATTQRKIHLPEEASF